MIKTLRTAASDTSIRQAAVGAVAGLGWYVSSKTLLTASVASLISAPGALAICALLPLALRRNGPLETPQPLPAQEHTELSVLGKHTMLTVTDRNGTLVEVSARLLQATGHTRDSLIGQPVTALYDPAARALTRRIRRTLQRGQPWEGQTPLRRADGQIFDAHTTEEPLFDATGRWIGSIALRRDISLQTAPDAGQDTKDAFDALDDAVWVVDAATLRLAHANAAGRALFEADAKAPGVQDLSDADAARQIALACRTLTGTGQSETTCDMQIGDLAYRVTVKSLPTDTGPARLVITLRDVTQALAEERTKSAFISTVSHELRSPLTSIKGSMGLLLSKAAGDLPDKATDLLEIAHRNADRLVLIINDILDLEKIAAGRMEFVTEDVDLGDLIHETNRANEMMRQRLGLTVRITGADGPLPLRTDPNRIIQVLTNLMSNACKFSRPGGIIDITASDAGHSLQISVSDQGGGIPPEDQHKVFHRFADLGNSARATKGGSGLGLSICKAIVESLGGTIGFETQVEVGTTFTVVLPKDTGSRPIIAEKGDMRAAS